MADDISLVIAFGSLAIAFGSLVISWRLYRIFSEKNLPVLNIEFGDSRTNDSKATILVKNLGGKAAKNVSLTVEYSWLEHGFFEIPFGQNQLIYPLLLPEQTISADLEHPSPIPEGIHQIKITCFTEIGFLYRKRTLAFWRTLTIKA